MSKKQTSKAAINVTTVAEKATTVVKKAIDKVKPVTEQIKKPTIKSLQQEAANLTEQLVYSNKRLLTLEEELRQAFAAIDELSNVAKQYKDAVASRDALIEELNKPWYKKVFSLFGN